MLQKRKFASLVAGLLACLLIAPAHGASVNSSINLGDNSENGGQSTVNGSITVGDNSTVNGSLNTVNGTIRVGKNTRLKDADTVNGSIRIDSGSFVDDVDSVNGSIRLGTDVTVDGDIEVVNGKITLDKGTTVADGVSNVNGEMEFFGARIGGNVSTVNGDISLSDASTVAGDLVVEKPGGWNWNKKKREPRRQQFVVLHRSNAIGAAALNSEPAIAGSIRTCINLAQFGHAVRNPMNATTRCLDIRRNDFFRCAHIGNLTRVKRARRGHGVQIAITEVIEAQLFGAHAGRKHPRIDTRQFYRGILTCR